MYPAALVNLLGLWKKKWKKNMGAAHTWAFEKKKKKTKTKNMGVAQI